MANSAKREQKPSIGYNADPEIKKAFDDYRKENQLTTAAILGSFVEGLINGEEVPAPVRARIKALADEKGLSFSDTLDIVVRLGVAQLRTAESQAPDDA